MEWLGGFFDGEGHVTIAHTPNGRKDGSRTFRLMVGISQKHIPLLESFVKEFGGRVATNNSNCWQWVIQCRAAARFLDLIEPYVFIKRREIEIGRELKWLGRLNTVEKKQRALELRQELMKLNKGS